jgi:hypothetical protein
MPNSGSDARYPARSGSVWMVGTGEGIQPLSTLADA